MVFKIVNQMRFISKSANLLKTYPGPLPDPHPHVDSEVKWRNMSLVGIPVVMLLSAYVYNQKQSEKVERVPFHPYEHLRLRSKRFPWGEGQRSLFHNPEVNPLPDGYEDENEE